MFITYFIFCILNAVIGVKFLDYVSNKFGTVQVKELGLMIASVLLSFLSWPYIALLILLNPNAKRNAKGFIRWLLQDITNCMKDW